MTLTSWLDNLRKRGCQITATDRVIHIRGRAARDTDHQHVKRFHHALELAAKGQHTEWWNRVLGRTTDPADLDELLPRSADDPDAWPCTQCGQPADHLDPQLLPWCNDHHQPAPEEVAA